MNPTHPLQLIKGAVRWLRVPFKRMTRPERGQAFVIGFDPWKTFLEVWLPEKNLIWRGTFGRFEFFTQIAPWLLSDPTAEVYVWGFKSPEVLNRFCARFRVPVVRVEDGFLRSIQLGATMTPPISLCFDRTGIYFDATGPSDLENLLNYNDFDAALQARARAGIDALVATKLSKYNVGRSGDPNSLYGEKTRERILVIGQVEGDMSLMKGCDRVVSNIEFVLRVARENPDAQIIFKPHPEVFAKTRSGQSDPSDLHGVALVLEQDVTLADAFVTVDRVCTMTSLAGFEALIRGIPVTCYGMPFYAGWGLTEDRQTCARRSARRNIEELFAAAYILYPRYFDPTLGKEIGFEEALELLQWMRTAADKQRTRSNAVSDRERQAVLADLRDRLDFPVDGMSGPDVMAQLQQALDDLQYAAEGPAQTQAKAGTGQQESDS